MNQILISNSSGAAKVISDLYDQSMQPVSVPDATVDLDLVATYGFALGDVIKRESLQTHLTSGDLTAKDENNNPITVINVNPGDATMVVGIPIDVSGKADGRILKYNDTAKKFEFQDESGGGGGFQEINVGPRGAVYGGTAIWAFVGDELCWQTPDGYTTSTYFSFRVPSNYSSNGKIKIETRRQGNANETITAWVDNGLDSTINGSSIKPGSTTTWEEFILTFGSTISPGDVINLQIDTNTTGSGTRIFQIKSIIFDAD